MAQTIILKRSSVAGKVPLTTDISLGELALNTYDGKLYTKKDDGTESIVDLSAGTGGGTGSYTASSSPPVSPTEGDRWYDIDLGIEFTYVNDGNSSQWVETSAVGGASSSSIVETQQVISQDVELSAGTNGLSVGPVEVAETYTVTVPENAIWAIV